MSSPGQAHVYRGSTVDELIPRIQRELGPDAIILRRREGLGGGILGFFQRSFVEIEAVPGGPRIDVYDDGEGEPTGERLPVPGLPLLDIPRSAPAPSYPAPAPSHARDPAVRDPLEPAGVHDRSFARGGALTAHGAYVTEQLAALAMAGPAEPIVRAGEVGGGVLAEPARAPSGPAPPRVEPRLEPRVESRVESRVEPGRDSFAAALASAEAQAPAPRASSTPAPWSVPPVRRTGKRVGVSIEERLVGFGMSETFAREAIERARAHVLPLAPGGGLTRGVRAALAQRVPVAPALPVTGAAIVVVGAGGSGKTSCCAALTRAYRRAGTLPVGYAALTWNDERPGLHMLLSPHVMWPTPVSTQRSLRALRRVRGEGLLVIDTPRLSPADGAGIRELAALLSELEPQRVVVALPATLGATAAAQLLQALRPLGANALVVTHADETDQIGVAVEAACAFDLAPEYRLDRRRSGAWRIGRIDPAGLAEWLLP
jgi:flagellar biosynthesis protein FlhF